MAPRLRGEFTLLAWDRGGRRGLLVPDQIGVRRIVFRRDGRRLWFGSEIRELLAILPSRPGPDPAAVANWLTARPAPEGATLYQGISCLGPGQMLELGLDGCRVVRYWRPRYEGETELRGEELVAEIRRRLEVAVERRMTPGAPVGVMMSGGLDSTSVAALALRAGGGGARAYSATFPDYPAVDESPWVDAFQAATDIPSVRLAARGEGIIAGGVEYLDRWELPLHAWSEAWAQPLLRRAAGDGVEAILSGEGGDELFGSRFALTADLLRGGRPLAAARFARGLPEAGGRAPRRVLAYVLWEYGLKGLPPARLEAGWRRLGLGRGGVPDWAGEAMVRQLRRNREPSWRALEGPRWWALLTDALTAGVHGYGLLDHVRRRAEQSGLEARHPLLDLDLFELMLRVPPAACSEGTLTRPLLRRATAGINPDATRLRPDKSVFDDVVTDALLGPELPALRNLLGEPKELGAFVRTDRVRELVDHPPGPTDPRSGRWGDDVLRLTAVELWLRLQSDRELPTRLQLP
jgi:asparagine synthase (glutamine-hydrolysing)